MGEEKKSIREKEEEEEDAKMGVGSPVKGVKRRGRRGRKKGERKKERKKERKRERREERKKKKLKKKKERKKRGPLESTLMVESFSPSGTGITSLSSIIVLFCDWRRFLSSSL